MGYQIYINAQLISLSPLANHLNWAKFQLKKIQVFWILTLLFHPC